MTQHKIEVNTERCVACGLCRWDCPVNNISIIERKAVINKQECIKCGHCVAICPKAAISMTNFSSQPMEYQRQIFVEPQQLMNAIQTRRSIRHFTKQEVSPLIVQQIIEAGRFTPSAKNLQNISYIVLKDEIDIFEQKAGSFMRKILPLARFFIKGAKDVKVDEQFVFKKAPIAIVVVSKGSFGKDNGVLAAANMSLMAESYGLGVLYNGFFTMVANYSMTVRKLLGLKLTERVIMTLAIGYPDVTYYRTVQREDARVVYK